ncbi:hypothetical protein PRZ48_007410 [Zasmidium cellare]|uniref:Clathrin light chain n=1 Tax=Zasmidium cellare TaxID=395010 RepID=A0ABR0EJ99_ZASCE|nr:hypothetical protein PRZ48_007410 [Zasmidium cellare]
MITDMGDIFDTASGSPSLSDSSNEKQQSPTATFSDDNKSAQENKPDQQKKPDTERLKQLQAKLVQKEAELVEARKRAADAKKVQEKAARDRAAMSAIVKFKRDIEESEEWKKVVKPLTEEDKKMIQGALAIVAKFEGFEFGKLKAEQASGTQEGSEKETGH